MPSLSDLIDNFHNIKVLCIGDIMLDTFIYGNVNRISPEAPVPVLKHARKEQKLGAASNVAKNITDLNAFCYLVGMIGDDEAGRQILSLLDSDKMEAFLPFTTRMPTTLKTRLIADNQQLLRYDIDSPVPPDDELLPIIDDNITAFVSQADIIILSDYNKGFLTKEICSFVIETAKKQNKMVLVDPKGDDFTKYRGADLIKPNLKEFNQITGQNLSPISPNFLSDLQQSANNLLDKIEVNSLLVTLSEYGMAYIKKGNSEAPLLLPTQAKEVFDVTGAGDTSIAALALGLASGATIPEAMQLANYAAGIVVGKFGVASPSPDELKDILAKQSFNDDWTVKRKIISLEQAEKIADKIRKQGKKIGFTNGCFDLLHLGHLHSFFAAKKLCDVLFVGINSDASIKRLKGEERPVQNELTRSVLLAGLASIDYVIIFDDSSAVKLVQAIKPDIIAKQGYNLENWPEAKEVIKMGGQSIVLEKLEDYSTTSLINKIGKRA